MAPPLVMNTPFNPPPPPSSVDFSGASNGAGILSTAGVPGPIDFSIFSPDGTKIFVNGGASPTKYYQFDLSVAWDLNSGSLAPGNWSAGVTLGSSIAANPNGLSFFMVDQVSPIEVQETILSTAWTPSAGTSTGDVENVSATVSSPKGIAFKPDGTKMYILDNNDNLTHQYTLSPAWDITSATFDSVTLNIGGSNNVDAEFSPDGSQFFTVDNTDQVVRGVDLAIPYDLSSTTSNPQTLDTGALGHTSPQAIKFKPDFTEMFLLSSANFRQIIL